MPLRPIVVVANRTALHLRDKSPLLAALRASRSRAVELHETHDLAELEAVVEGLRARPVRAVVFAGGDGTLMAGLTALARAFADRPLPSVAIVPGGTVCTVGRSFGVQGNRTLYAHRLLRALSHGTARSQVTPTLAVTDDEARRVGFIFGFGLVSSFFRAYYGSGDPRSLGLGAAARIVARVFVGSLVGAGLAREVLARQPARATIDGVAAPHDGYSLFVASVIEDLGLSMRVTYRAKTRHDRFQVVGSALGPRALGPQLPLVLTGRPLLGGGVDALARHVSVELGPPHPSYVLDGELLTSRRVEVALGPEVTVKVP